MLTANNEKDMIFTDDLILSALRFRAQALWKKLDDRMIFGVRLLDGTIGYCCVMGNGGSHYSLGFYRGEKGFSTYLKIVHNGRISDNEMFERFLTYDCVNCDFCNVGDLDYTKEQKAQIKEVAAANDVKITRPNGYPQFIRMDGATQTFGLESEQDAADMIEALNAGCEVSRALVANNNDFKSLGFDPDGKYASVRGGKTIPLLERREDGSYSWTTTETPGLRGEKYRKIAFTDSDVADSLLKMQHKGIYQSRAIHLPVPVGNKQRHTYPLILTIVGMGNKIVFPVMGESADSEKSIVDRFAKILYDNKVCPSAIEVCDEHTVAMLADFCEKTGIRLDRVKSMPHFNMVWNYLIRKFMARGVSQK